MEVASQGFQRSHSGFMQSWRFCGCHPDAVREGLRGLQGLIKWVRRWPIFSHTTIPRPPQGLEVIWFSSVDADAKIREIDVTGDSCFWKSWLKSWRAWCSVHWSQMARTAAFTSPNIMHARAVPRGDNHKRAQDFEFKSFDRTSLSKIKSLPNRFW